MPRGEKKWGSDIWARQKIEGTGGLRSCGLRALQKRRINLYDILNAVLEQHVNEAFQWGIL
jgi:hypothetical protein